MVEKSAASYLLIVRSATADKVGYVCYGCTSARFPVNRALFRHHPVGTEIPVRSEPDLQGAAL